MIEQDHRRIKRRLLPMLGLKQFQTEDIVIRYIELAEKMKRRATLPEIWRAALVT